MTIRTLLVALTGAETDADALATGFTVATLFGVHLDAVYVRVDPATEFKGLRLQEGWRALVDEMETMRALEVEAERGAAEARRRFEAAAAAARAPIIAQPTRPRQLSARFREVGGGNDVLADEGRLTDLLVFGRVTLGDQPRAYVLFEAALLGSGRPLLVAPSAAPSAFGSTVAIAWHGNVHAARAVAGALPFLEQAGAVHVITAETDAIVAGEGQRLAGYLAWHGIEAKVAVLPAGGQGIGEAILGKAAELGADLLVMGGYGHSRVREVILGGVTRHVLEHAKLPVLIAH